MKKEKDYKAQRLYLKLSKKKTPEQRKKIYSKIEKYFTEKNYTHYPTSL